MLIRRALTAIVWVATVLFAHGCGNLPGTDSQALTGDPSSLKGIADVGQAPTDGDFAELCHAPPGDPDGRHTIQVGGWAAVAHRAHGDTPGPCPEASSATDADGDGVPDLRDECPDTPEGDEVDENGCTVIVLTADAGPDLTAFTHEMFRVTGTGQVVAGAYDEANLVFDWKQLDGPVTEHESNSPTLIVFTSGAVGHLTFQLTVSTADYLVVATDEFVLGVVKPRITGVAAATFHNVVLRENGTASLWGWNRHGQLGDGTGVNDVASIDVSATSTLFAKTDGTVWTFGTNALSNSWVSVQIIGVSDVVQVAALSWGGIFVTGDRSVWGFGHAANAQCDLAGEAHIGDSGVLGPIPIPDLPTNIVSVASGSHHTVALDTDGTAWVWGARFGCTPTAVMNDVTAVSAGESNHCLFLKSDGTAWAMGFNLHGQLGNGTNASNYTTPTQVLDLTDVVAVAAGDRHSLFLQGDGTLWVSGWNHNCQLGLGPDYPVNVNVPARVDLVDVVHVAGGDAHSVAVVGDDSVWVWGNNNVGQLSRGTLTALPFTVCTPTPIEFADVP